MVRPTQLLHTQREPAVPLQAATILLLRDATDTDGRPTIEVLMTRRSASASFGANAYVFPGGGIDPLDESAHAIAARRANQDDLQLTQAIAAIRESFEELGILLARHRDGRPATDTDIARMDRQAPFAPQCEALGLVLAADTVFNLAHWTADRDLKRRFAVPFLVARMPDGQTPVADETEQFEPEWVKPAEAVARHAAGSFFMMYPTIRTLERLAAFASVDALLAACAHGQPLFVSCPRSAFLGGTDVRYMEDEAPFGELELVSPDGQMVHTLDWQTERAVPLLRNVLRLTAPNAGAMTGPGTNSYLVGDAETGYIAIDPGPSDPVHVARLHAAAGGDIRMIVCTHSHPDHSPAAALLQALCPARPPILGLPSAPTARPASAFTPDRSLSNGELLSLTGPEQKHDLMVVFTPGHAANHLCLVLLQDGLLFSGDHILNGSTTVIDPPDGNMADYMDSLDVLAAACEQHAIDFILPAHGYVIGSAPQAIARLKAHRLAREARVAAAMRALPDGTLQDWLPLAYDDVPQRMWPMAARSLLAHAERLCKLAGRRGHG